MLKSQPAHPRPRSMACFSGNELLSLQASLPPHAAGGVEGSMAGLTSVQKARMRIKYNSAERILGSFTTLEGYANECSSAARSGPPKSGGVAADSPGHPARNLFDMESAVGHASEPSASTNSGGCKRRWRPDAPRQRQYARGSAAKLDASGCDAEAVHVLRSDIFAASTKKSATSRLKLWFDRCRARRWDPKRITPARLEIAAALLKKGRYRAGGAYLTAIKRFYIRHGGRWSEELALVVSDVSRSLTRGQGPPRQADPLPLEQISKLDPGSIRRLCKTYWPAAGVDVAIVACAWMMREIETAAAAVADITVHSDGTGGCGWAEWLLPASKTDTKAHGTVRSLACACPSPLCPVGALRRVHGVAVQLAGSRQMHTGDSPLVPGLDGSAMSKAHMVIFYQDLARAAAGRSDARITGHSPRVTGAMRMALAGHSEWIIQVFGRWGSATVLQYVRLAILGSNGGNIAQITENMCGADKEAKSLESIATQLLSQREPKSGGRHKVMSAMTIERAMRKVALGCVGRGEHGKDQSWQGRIEDSLREAVTHISEVTSSELRFVHFHRGRRHVVLSDGRCLCGRVWRSDFGKVILAAPSPESCKHWCKCCYRRAAGLVGEGV